MKKFLTIALLVMALCVVSIAVSAAPTATADFENGVATVTVTPESTGQTVVLVVNGTLTEIPANDLTALEKKIIYVDQTAGTKDKSVTFNFVPRASLTDEDPYDKYSTVFYSDGTNQGDPVELFAGIKNTVKLELNGGIIDADKNITSIKEGETKTLPGEADLNKVGYKFDGWYADSEFSEEKLTTITGVAEEGTTLTYYAKWTPFFEVAGNDVDDPEHSNTELAGEPTDIADAGYYTKDDKKEYAVSVTATVADGVPATIAGYGFYIFNEGDGTKAPIIQTKVGELVKGDKFFAIAEGIPEGQEAVSVYFKPFVYDAAGNTYWGAGNAYKVNDFNPLKNLGTK